MKRFTLVSRALPFTFGALALALATAANAQLIYGPGGKPNVSNSQAAEPASSAASTESVPPLFLGAGIGAQTANPLELQNPGFELGQEGKLPNGWRFAQHAGAPAYQVGLDRSVKASGQSSLKIHRLHKEVYGMVFQEFSVPVSQLQGKELRISAKLKSDKVGPGGWILFANFTKSASDIEQVRAKPLSGSQDWTDSLIQVKVPEGTVAVTVGMVLEDEGTGWADDVKLQVLP